ncbi:flagellar protein FlaG [Metabacillus halosaccharovorans]|uniref:Flagellar protein FlaG n=1 Tax=Metabacillus halosaccharovorans TaxID=930124 RepID=A0ABT3DBM5_9BACI|nr:flagellar protein FlaG [Metabacillus halosaccharovorans]MCV9884464.1 flagellar protein FlaG [Metabacillus halosaccharovorans]
MSIEFVSKSSASHILESIKTSTTNKASEEVISSNKIEENEGNVKKDELEKTINSMNDFLQASNTHLKFEYHEKLNEYYVTIVDNKTEEVVREIPSKKLLDIYSAMTEFLGIIVDKKI